MGKLSTAEKKERDEYILELIKSTGETGVQLKTIAEDCNMSPSATSKYMTAFRATHPEIQAKRAHHSAPTFYIWVEPEKKDRETHSPFPNSRKDRVDRNSEGYFDPTAGYAIKRVLFGNKGGDLIMPEAGEVWEVEETSGKSAYIYVLACEEGAAQCIRLYNMDECDNAAGINRAIRIKIGGMTYIGDASRVTYKPKKYMLRRVLAKDNSILPGVRKAVASVLGILSFRYDAEPKVIEKEIIKEVPVEKIVYRDKEEVTVPEGYISVTEAELQDLRHQVEIWKTAFMAVSAKN